jgi:ribosome-binding factor A
MAGARTRKVGKLIRQELSLLLTTRVRDPRLSLVTISEVEPTPDLKRAFVYFTCPSGREEEAGAGFEQAAGFLRRELAGRLKLKFMPELVYSHDQSLDRGAAMDSLLASLKDQPAPENRS